MLQTLMCRTDVAQKYGLDCAVFLHNIVYWVQKNQAEGRHFYDGRYWTYASRKGLMSMYPLWSDSQIKRIIAKLKDAGALLVGDYNENRMVRTNWYSPSDEILALYGEAPPSAEPDESAPMQCPESPCALGENGQCLYNENKKIQQEVPPIAPQGASAEILFDRFWAVYPRKQAKKDARKAWMKLKPDIALCRIMAKALDWQKRSTEWNEDDGKYIPLAATWIRGRRWEDKPRGGSGGAPPGGVVEQEGVTFVDDE